MRLIWSSPARFDLLRLNEFLAPKSRRAAKSMLAALRAGAEQLIDRPRLGQRIDSIETLEIRRIFVAGYEVRYQIVGNDIRILRIWHTRESR